MSGNYAHRELTLQHNSKKHESTDAVGEMLINSAEVSMFYLVMIQLASLAGLERNISPKLKIGKYEL